MVQRQREGLQGETPTFLVNALKKKRSGAYVRCWLEKVNSFDSPELFRVGIQKGLGYPGDGPSAAGCHASLQCEVWTEPSRAKRAVCSSQDSCSQGRDVGVAQPDDSSNRPPEAIATWRRCREKSFGLCSLQRVVLSQKGLWK